MMGGERRRRNKESERRSRARALRKKSFFFCLAFGVVENTREAGSGGLHIRRA